MQIFVDDESVNLYDAEFPWLLLKLKPREQIRLSARAVLGVGLRNACWNAASTYALDDETEDGVILFMFKAVQYDEYTLMDRAIAYFEERLDLIANMMEKMYLTEEEKTGTFVATINGEDYTIGTPLAYELQSHPDVMMASCGMPDNLVDQVRIEIVTDDPESMVKIIQESTARLQAKIAAVKRDFAEVRKSTFSQYLEEDSHSKFYDHDVVREEDPVKSSSKSKSDSKPSKKTNTKAKVKAVKRKK